MKIKATLVILVLLLLTGCASSTRKSIKQTAPTINCEQHAPAEHIDAPPALPPPTTTDSAVLWKAITQLEAWGSGLVGNINAEVGKRRTTATCLDAHKASGDIR